LIEAPDFDWEAPLPVLSSNPAQHISERCGEKFLAAAEKTPFMLAEVEAASIAWRRRRGAAAVLNMEFASLDAEKVIGE
jgi:hypothetical protein